MVETTLDGLSTRKPMVRPKVFLTVAVTVELKDAMMGNQTVERRDAHWVQRTVGELVATKVET